MKILLAPDKFKDALSAQAVCAALADGVSRARPDAIVMSCPLADGGEGTGPLLAQALGAEQRTADVLDPLGRRRRARWWYAAGPLTAVVEMAEASGLALLAPGERNAMRASSFGTGELIRAAREAGAQQILVAVGGSATVDGGTGCLQALGWRLRDASGREIPSPVVGGGLAQIATIEPPADFDRNRPPVRVEVLCDVDNPLVGPRGAAPVFGPQKGASPSDVVALAAGLDHWADVLERAAGVSVRDVPGGGAAGGLPAALHAAFAARLVRGFDRVADLVELDGKLRSCDSCLTGEGRLDDQSLHGKVVAGVAAHARAAGVPVAVFAGAVRLAHGETKRDLAAAFGVRDIVVITPPDTPLELALPQTAENLRLAVARYLSE